ncbi:MAG: phosphatidate cytidylyltransferase [Bdellovibrionales bacterium]
MFENTLWVEEMYRETAIVVLAFIAIIGTPFFIFRNKSTQNMAIWASIKSWFFYAPAVLVLFSFPKPWPLIFVTLASIYASKIFFQMVGMYHRTWFVWVTYAFLVLTAYLVYQDSEWAYNLVPMLFMGCLWFIPLLRNSPKRMIQYIALSTMAFMFFGWSLLHLIRMYDLENGIYMIIYIYILSEVAENSNILFHNFFGKHKFLTNISSYISIEGVLFSIFFTVLIAFGMRHLLPIRSEPYWLSAGLIASIVGHIGNLIISVVRKDLGIKPSGIFILGRGDIVDRLDKMIFVAPVFYYIFVYLQHGLPY